MLAVVGVSDAVALVLIGALHIAWLRTPWPWASDAAFREAVFGGADRETPPAALYVAIGVALIGAGVLVLMRAELLPHLAPAWLLTIGTWALTAALLLRGAGGFLLSSGAATAFRRLNSIVYSPLCVGLAVLTGTTALSG